MQGSGSHHSVIRLTEPEPAGLRCAPMAGTPALKEMRMRRPGNSIAVQLDQTRIPAALVLAGLVVAMNVTSTIVALMMAY